MAVVHGWGGFTKTVRESKVLAPIDKREEVGGYKVHAVRRGMSMAETIEHYAMPKKIRVQGLRKTGEGRRR